jgi:tripartite-type tricarboxylate transporter receptor subunit TctC
MMKIPRRNFLHLAAGAPALLAISPVAMAQAYPTRPVRLIVGFPAGGTADIAARLIGQWLSDRLGKPFIIENRPGANANIATEAVVRAPPDGHTLLAASVTNVMNAGLYKLNFDFIRDIAMVAGVLRSPLVLEVHPDVPATTVTQLIAYTRANPGKVNMASYGTGTISHVAGELFKMASGADMFHVPYRGSSPMLTDLLGGQVQAAFDNLPASIAHIRAGKLRALAVTTARPLEALPDIPTLGQFLPGFEASAWSGIGAPRNTPADIIDKLNTQINAGLADPNIKARMADIGGSAFTGSPAEFARFVGDETEKWGKVIRLANIKVE